MKGLEKSLGSLAPASGLDRDRLMFAAGRASARVGPLHPSRVPAAIAVLSSLAAAALGLLLVFRPAHVVERVVLRTVPSRPPSLPVPEVPVFPAAETSAPRVDFTPWEAGQADYLRRRQEVLRWGVDMLPLPEPRSSPSTPTLTPGTVHEDFLELFKLF